MALANQNFDMYASESKFIDVEVTKEDGSVEDLSGSTIKWVAVRGRDILLQKDSDGNGIEIGSDGVFTIALHPDDTRNLLGNLYHEAVVIDPFGNETTVMVGNFKIIASFI